MIRRLAVGAGLLLLVAATGVCAGFAAFVAAVQRPTSPPPLADAIVALTGGADRVETALRLLATGQAGLLLISGVAHGATLSDLARYSGVDPAPLAGCITLGRVATTTSGNAEETAEWTQAHHVRSLIVVTATYHMPRALMELRRAMPGVTLYPVAVQPAVAHRWVRMRLLGSEYVKLIGVWLGANRFAVHAARTRANPVDNSVSG